MRELWPEILEHHQGKLVGTCVGIALGLGIMWVGFFWALFIGLCGAAGYFIGQRLDEEGDGLAEAIEELFFRALRR